MHARKQRRQENISDRAAGSPHRERVEEDWGLREKREVEAFVALGTLLHWLVTYHSAATPFSGSARRT
eukprot:3804234-Rhodomonas_salina.1